MKRLRTIFIVAFALAGGWSAFAQTNSNVPRATDYPAFSRFITDRNIFDPNRQPHYSSSRSRPPRTKTRVSPSAPAFSLVGTMSYEKGMFAFFSGNSDELKNVLPATEKIAGYTVTEIVTGRVTLQSTNQQETLQLKVGDVMREENGKWVLAGAGEVPAGESGSSTEATSSSGGETPAAAPVAGGEVNDVLKRLMEKRAKETQ